MDEELKCLLGGVVIGLIIGLLIGWSFLGEIGKVSTEAKDEVCQQLMGEDYVWHDEEHLMDYKFYCINEPQITFDNTTLIQKIG